MQIASTLRQVAVTAAVFGGLIVFVSAADARVRDRITDLIFGAGPSVTARAGDLAHALASAARHQTIENAPLVIFAAAGAVLFVFMTRA